jgi:hypothetical protein
MLPALAHAAAELVAPREDSIAALGERWRDAPYRRSFSVSL